MSLSCGDAPRVRWNWAVLSSVAARLRQWQATSRLAVGSMKQTPSQYLHALPTRDLPDHTLISAAIVPTHVSCRNTPPHDPVPNAGPLDSQIRPYLMADGGNVEFVEIDGPVVYLRLQGACGSCPSSLTTMTMGIKRRLMEKIPVRLLGRAPTNLRYASVMLTRMLSALVRTQPQSCIITTCVLAASGLMANRFAGNILTSRWVFLTSACPLLRRRYWRWSSSWMSRRAWSSAITTLRRCSTRSGHT